MKETYIPLWNVTEADESQVQLVSRTSNALERYNRFFNNIVPRAHPNLIVFVAALLDEAHRIIQRLEDVRSGREIPPVYEDISYPDIPAEFESFKFNVDKKESATVPVRKNPKRKGRGKK